MSRINSRRKGRRGENELANEHLALLWPGAVRNLDQFGDDKRDVLHVPGVHFQVKRTERLAIWDALKQAETEARDGDLPVVAFRRNRSRWYGALDFDELAALIKFREQA